MIALSNTSTLSKENFHFNALVVGGKGEGKTTFCAGFPDPIFVDFDGGMGSLVGSSVPYIAQDKVTFESILELALAVQRRSPEGKIALRLGAETVNVPCQTIVFDSMTKGHSVFLKSAMSLANRKTPAIQDWGMALDRIITLIDSLKPYVHVLVVCHYEIIKDENLERVMARIRMPGQLTDLLPISCDEMWRIRSEIDMNRKRRVSLMTVNDGIFPAATRHGRLGMPPIIDITDDGIKPFNPYELIMSSIKWPQEVAK